MGPSEFSLSLSLFGSFCFLNFGNKVSLTILTSLVACSCQLRHFREVALNLELDFCFSLSSVFRAFCVLCCRCASSANIVEVVINVLMALITIVGYDLVCQVKHTSWTFMQFWLNIFLFFV